MWLLGRFRLVVSFESVHLSVQSNADLLGLAFRTGYRTKLRSKTLPFRYKVEDGEEIRDD